MLVVDNFIVDLVAMFDRGDLDVSDATVSESGELRLTRILLNLVALLWLAVFSLSAVAKETFKLAVLKVECCENSVFSCLDSKMKNMKHMKV